MKTTLVLNDAIFRQAKAARELQDTIAAADFRSVDQGMWE